MNRARAIDGAAVIASAVFATVVMATDLIDRQAEESYSAAAIALVALGCLALAWRRLHPMTVMIVVLGVHVATIVLGDLFGLTPLVLAATVALYTAARWANRWIHGLVIVAAAASAAIAGAAAEADESGQGFLAELEPEVGFLAIPILLGYGLGQRADRLQQTIENEATARVQAERLRIARDLHDVVAHRLATITLHAGVAAHRVERDPAAAEEALHIITATGKESLEELRALVGVLRSTDERIDAPLQPAPSDPNDITDLLTRAEADGLRVTTHVTGEFPRGVTDGVVIAAHRIIGEALTNAARHAGPVPVTVCIAHHDGEATIRVENAKGPGGNRPGPSTGVGIEGMAERAVAVGGTLTAEPTSLGGYLVEAHLPYSRREQ